MSENGQYVMCIDYGRDSYMTKHFKTVIIGAGQAGLAASYHLTQQKRDHVILEKHRIGEAWRSAKWDSFTLVTPNWMLQLPGFAYDGDDPDGFMVRNEIVQYLEDFVEQFDPPVRTSVEVTAIEPADVDFKLATSDGFMTASNVIVATGTFQSPNIPSLAAKLPPQMNQLHSSAYRNPHQLPDGAVLIVGSAQSGCQIAEELNAAGRKVYLATGGADRLPRRYRGKDSFWWADQLGIFDQTVDKLPSRDARFNPNPQVTGKDGGHTLSLHHLARDGVILMGRMLDANGTEIKLADDLVDNLKRADKFAAEFKKGVDKLIEKKDMDLSEDDQPELHAGYDTEVITELDLNTAGITSVIWATGYNYGFSWIDFPVFDDVGYPVTERGITDQPGLYFVGLHFLHTRESGLLSGVGADAAHVVQHLLQTREPTHEPV
jgi:putative flavoprotein involved in K+ transport